MKKPLAALLCAIMVAGALTGCGSKTTETKAPETTAETNASETTGETKTDEATGDKVWVIATDTVFRPFE